MRIPKKRRPRRFRNLVGLFLVIGLGFAGFRYVQPVGEPVFQQEPAVASATTAPQIAWPEGQSSFGTTRDGVLASKPNQTAQPTASTAKLITVLTVLDAKPLQKSEKGPSIPVTASDMKIYDEYYRIGGSQVAVKLGDSYSQYEMLQGILIRSANNFADSLAIWAFDSLPEYQKAAQKFVDELGMTHTQVGTDASGLSPTTVSTAEDLTKLGIAAMENEIVREIVRQPSVNFPSDGKRSNTNWLLGENGIVGIKTGNTDEAGGVFIIASEHKSTDGELPITLVATVQGSSTSEKSMTEAERLIKSIKPQFEKRVLAEKGQKLGTIITPWGAKSDVVAEQDIVNFQWKYADSPPEISYESKQSFKANEVVGTIKISDKTSNIVASENIAPPPIWWRISTSR